MIVLMLVDGKRCSEKYYKDDRIKDTIKIFKEIEYGNNRKSNE